MNQDKSEMKNILQTKKTESNLKIDKEYDSYINRFLSWLHWLFKLFLKLYIEFRY